MAEPEHLLVRGPNWTGDLIMASPGFRALRAHFPSAHITLHARAGQLPLLAGAPWFDELLPLASYGRGARALVREGLGLRPRRFDLGLCLPDSASSALLMRIAGVRRVVGYGRGVNRALLHRVLPLPSPSPSPTTSAERETPDRRMLAREAYVLGLVGALGAEPRGTHLELFVTPAEQAAADAELREHGVTPETPRAILAPGASFGPSKLWPAASFARVGDALAEAGAAVVIVGTREERALGREVLDEMKAPAADLCGSLGLGPLKGVMRGSRVLVCNDAGARHVGVALGVPSVVLMGPTALEKTNWNLERVTVFTAGVHCRPCYRRTCPIDHRCMTRIPPEAVADEARAALGAEPGAWRGRIADLPGGEGGAA